MSEPRNGLSAKVEANTGQIGRLWDEKASRESVTTLHQDLRDLRGDLKEEVGGLRRTLIIVSGTWLFGTITFLIAALELAR